MNIPASIPSPAPQLPSLPSACAECLETVLSAVAGALAQKIPTKQFRSLEGKIRFDFGASSLISDPASQLRMLLDHVKLEVRILTPGANLPAVPGMPAIPGMPMPAIPSAPNVNIVQLGTSVIDGLEAEGLRYVFQAVDALKPPSIASWEVWLSTKLQLPIVTRIVGAFGERTNICKCTAMAVPDSLFQIPPGYKVIPMEPPVLPQMPSAPALPSAPTLPSASALPSAPTLPSAPALLPSVPTLPTVPSLPKPPSL
jgi:hypothetical protein